MDGGSKRGSAAVEAQSHGDDLCGDCFATAADAKSADADDDGHTRDADDDGHACDHATSADQPAPNVYAAAPALPAAANASVE